MAFGNPVFKVLAHNDTGGAVGHQGGVLIPKDLESYFPKLLENVTPQNPTVSAYITAQLFNGDKHVDTVTTRYQYQTWGAQRRAERRITGNLGAIRSKAEEHDILLMERDLAKSDTYKLTLIKNGTPAYAAIRSKRPGRRWGWL